MNINEMIKEKVSTDPINVIEIPRTLYARQWKKVGDFGIDFTCGISPPNGAVMLIGGTYYPIWENSWLITDKDGRIIGIISNKDYIAKYKEVS